MIGTVSGEVLAGIGAALFGLLYAMIVYVPLHGKHGGYTSLLVVVGVMGTLFFFGLAYGFEWALKIGLFFVATGGPMVLGEAVKTKWEDWKADQQAAREIEELLKDDDAQAATE